VYGLLLHNNWIKMKQKKSQLGLSIYQNQRPTLRNAIPIVICLFFIYFNFTVGIFCHCGDAVELAHASPPISSNETSLCGCACVYEIRMCAYAHMSHTHADPHIRDALTPPHIIFFLPFGLWLLIVIVIICPSIFFPRNTLETLPGSNSFIFT